MSTRAPSMSSDPRPMAPHAYSLGNRIVKKKSSSLISGTVKPKAMDLSSVTKVDWPSVSARTGFDRRPGHGHSS